MQNKNINAITTLSLSKVFCLACYDGYNRASILFHLGKDYWNCSLELNFALVFRYYRIFSLFSAEKESSIGQLAFRTEGYYLFYNDGEAKVFFREI